MIHQDSGDGKKKTHQKKSPLLFSLSFRRFILIWLHWTKQPAPELYLALAAYFVQVKMRFPVYSDVSLIMKVERDQIFTE